MRRYAIPLFASNAVALATLGLSYLLYSRLLSAQQFGVYSAALALGNLVTLVLDGGVKVSIIKHAVPPTESEESALLHLMLAFSVVLLAALALLRGIIPIFVPTLAHQTDFVASFTLVYIVSYPWIGLPTAQLERRLDYARLAWIESAGVVLERGAPVIFLYFSGLGLYSFVCGLALGRLLRVVSLAYFHRVSVRLTRGGSYRSVMKFLLEGAWYQLGVGSSLLRDNLHLLMIGPLYGSAWVGYYAWGLQLCMIASQVFVQISARVSVPIAAQATSFSERWRTVIRQVGLLTAITAPILAAGLSAAPSTIHHIFANKWLPALSLLPYLFLRMLPGVATAPVGALVLVDSGARSYAIALWLWTFAEVGLAAVSIRLFGVDGLAISYGVAAWAGIYLLLRELRRPTMQLFRATISAIFARPALWASIVLAIPSVSAQMLGQEWPQKIDLSWTLAVLVVVVAVFYAIDTDLRVTLFRRKR